MTVQEIRALGRQIAAIERVYRKKPDAYVLCDVLSDCRALVDNIAESHEHILSMCETAPDALVALDLIQQELQR